MKILLSGKNGFLGRIFYEELQDSHNLVSISRSEGADIVANLAVDVPNLPQIDLVIHNAGHAHLIPRTSSQIAEIYKTNVDGTKNLLNALDNCVRIPKTIVYISSVAVYGLEEGLNIGENHAPNPITPYAISKYQAEDLIIDWCKSRNVSSVILRLPLVVARNPKGNLADLYQSILQGWFIQINQNKAKKSAVIASDVAKLIPNLLNRSGIYNLTDRYHPSINEIATAIAIRMNKTIYLNIPLSILQYIAKLGDFAKKIDIPSPIDTARLSKIVTDLTFSDDKACQELNWNPTSVTEWLKNNSL